MIKKVLLNKVNVDEARRGVTASTGKEWTAYPVGIEVDGMWHNGFLFDKDFVDDVAAHRGQEMILDFFEEEYQGDMKKKFQKPSQEDATAMLYDELISRIEALEAKVGINYVPSVPKQDSQTPEQLKRDEIDAYIKDKKDNIDKKTYTDVTKWLDDTENPPLSHLESALKKLKDKTDDLPF